MHLVARLANREPITTWGALRQIWLLPYGLPLEIVCDIDGAFQRGFEAAADEHGIALRHVPAEGHHQLGKIE